MPIISVIKEWQNNTRLNQFKCSIVLCPLTGTGGFVSRSVVSRISFYNGNVQFCSYLVLTVSYCVSNIIIFELRD